MVPTYHVQCTYIQKSKLSPGLSHNNMKENEILTQVPPPTTDLNTRAYNYIKKIVRDA